MIYPSWKILHSFLSSIILFSKGKPSIIPGSQNDAIISNIEANSGEGLVIVITSSEGTIFDSSTIQTTLTAAVYKDGAAVSDISTYGTLKWYIESTNLVYIKTTDTVIDLTKTYYVYDSTNKIYNVVANPVVADIGTYYEQTNQAEGSSCTIGATDVANIVVKLESSELGG